MARCRFRGGIVRDLTKKKTMKFVLNFDIIDFFKYKCHRRTYSSAPIQPALKFPNLNFKVVVDLWDCSEDQELAIHYLPINLYASQAMTISTTLRLYPSTVNPAYSHKMPEKKIVLSFQMHNLQITSKFNNCIEFIARLRSATLLIR